jgi:23S rRNA pseudouridine1911/1915/1917 synthase
MILEYTAHGSDAGKSVKQIIQREFSLSARTMTKLKKDGGILVNGIPVTVRYLLCEGDILRLNIEDRGSQTIEPSDIPLDVLYEDDDLLLINKPLGMPIHPSQGHHSDTLANAVMYRYRNESFTFRAITRLDGDTTGVTLIARNALSAQRLTDSLQKGEIRKEYAAVVCGVPVYKSGVIDAPIARCEDSIIKRRISPDGKKAVTEYEVVFSTPDESHSLITAFPITGRTHQIRVHMAHIGCPLENDFLYGERGDSTYSLRCTSLSFIHPKTKENITINIEKDK